MTTLTAPQEHTFSKPLPMAELIAKLKTHKWVYLYSHNYGMGWTPTFVKWTGGVNPTWLVQTGMACETFNYFKESHRWSGQAYWSAPRQLREPMRLLRLYRQMPTRPECQVLDPPTTLLDTSEQAL